MKREELEDKLSRLQAGDEVYNLQSGWHEFLSFIPNSKYPIRCKEEGNTCNTYTMTGIWQLPANLSDVGRNISDVRFQTRTMTPQPIGSAELKASFADARVGDKVWCGRANKIVEITTIHPDSKYPIETSSNTYTIDGCEVILPNDYSDYIYWQAPTNNPPERAPEPMTSEEFLLAAWELFKLAEKVGYSYSYDNTEERKSLHIWDMGSIMSSCTTAREDLAEFKRRLESA